METHSIFTKKYWNYSNRYIRGKASILKKINEYSKIYATFNDDDFKVKTLEFKERINNGNTLDDILPEAFALVKEASAKILNMRHFDEQLIGGIALHERHISEMKTGEGKTLVATLPSYLNALLGKGVHVITVNDYLAKRDAENLRPLYDCLGINIGYIQSGMFDEDRAKAYACDITYGNNSEFGFDYLKDNMKYDLESMITRRYCAIIDEADSVLIDEAKTPLIISGETELSEGQSYQNVIKTISDIVKSLHKEEDYIIEDKTKSIFLTEEGSINIEKKLQQTQLLDKDSQLYETKNTNIVHYINQSLKAHFILMKNVDYIVKNRSIVIIDELTGRQMLNRRFSDGLQAMIEAKEKIPVEEETQTSASITIQNYFKLYSKLSGMTGTAETEKVELEQIYGLNVIVIPTNKPMIRKDDDDEIYKTFEEKVFAIIGFIKTVHDKGQPILLGTNSIEASDVYSQILKKHKITHDVLNAKNHEKEAKIIANAGRFKRVTIATNMAGRGTDIKLGGDIKYMIQEKLLKGSRVLNTDIEEMKENIKENNKKVIEAGGLAVIGTERNDSRRIDNQLRGRSGRQGDPGLSRFFISLEDSFMKAFGVESLNIWLPRLGLKKNEAIKHPMITSLIKNAQAKIESRNFASRKFSLEYDNIMSEERNVVYSMRDIFILHPHASLDTIHQIMLDLAHNMIDLLFYQNEAIDSNQLKKIIKIFNYTPEQKTKNNIIKEMELYIEEKINSIKNTIQDDDDKLRFFKILALKNLDTVWRQHLLATGHLKEVIHLRSYGQKDPLMEYKMESSHLFKAMIYEFQVNVSKDICHLQDINHYTD